MKTKTIERITNQKKIILDYLKSVDTHPSAEKVYLTAKRKLPRISRGTVYRILKNLKEKNEIFEIPAGTAHYDADFSSHAHFICQKCNQIFDIFDICSKCDILKTKKTRVGKIKNYQVYFYGECKNCKKRKTILPRLSKRN